MQSDRQTDRQTEFIRNDSKTGHRLSITMGLRVT